MSMPGQSLLTVVVALSAVVGVITLPMPGHYGTPSSSDIYHQQGYDGYGAYRFGYKVDDEYTYNHQNREEEKDEQGVVRGSYSLVEPDGNVRTVHYIADHNGFRAYVKNTLKPDSVHGEHDTYVGPALGSQVYNRYGGY